MVSSTYLRALVHPAEGFDRLNLLLNVGSRWEKSARFPYLLQRPQQRSMIRWLLSRPVLRRWKSRSSRCPAIPMAALSTLFSPLRRGVPSRMFRLT
jgi:hypothetical protein